MITEILAGLSLLKTYDADAPIVTQAYILAIPAILVGDVSAPHQASLTALHWYEHPLYGCYYYKTSTITELADITGEGDGDIPPYPAIQSAP